MSTVKPVRAPSPFPTWTTEESKDWANRHTAGTFMHENYVEDQLIDNFDILEKALNLFPCQFFSSVDVRQSCAQFFEVPLAGLCVFGRPDNHHTPHDMFIGPDISTLHKRGHIQAPPCLPSRGNRSA